MITDDFKQTIVHNFVGIDFVMKNKREVPKKIYSYTHLQDQNQKHYFSLLLDQISLKKNTEYNKNKL